MKLAIMVATILLTVSAFGQQRPVLALGNSDAAMNTALWPEDFPGVAVLTRSFYSRPCAYVLQFLPFVMNWYEQVYGGPPPVIVNYEGQCDVEQQNPVASYLTCAEQLAQAEHDQWPETPQIWVNVAPEPQYSLGPPSNYPGNIWALVLAYNWAGLHGTAALPGMPAYAVQHGIQLQIVDVYSLTVLGIWGNPAYFTRPSVDLNPAGETAADLGQNGIGAALCQYVTCQ